MPRLLVQALECLDAVELPYVRLEVRPRNTAARQIYESVGFVVSGETRDRQGPWLVVIRHPSGDFSGRDL